MFLMDNEMHVKQVGLVTQYRHLNVVISNQVIMKIDC